MSSCFSTEFSGQHQAVGRLARQFSLSGGVRDVDRRYFGITLETQQSAPAPEQSAEGIPQVEIAMNMQHNKPAKHLELLTHGRYETPFGKTIHGRECLG
jgi:hypothetical protein